MTYPNELTNPAQANWPARVNEALKSLRSLGLYAPNDLTTTGLTLGYFGGALSDSVIVSDGTVGPLAASDTSYVVAHRTTGAVTHATTTTNWDDTSTYGRLFSVDTGGSSITTIRPWHLLAGGIFDHGFSPGSVDAADVSYHPSDLDDWTSSDDPGDVNDALDQLADRVSGLEGSSAVTSVNGQTGAVVTVPLASSPAFSATPTIDTSDKDVIYFGELTANVTAFNLSGTRAKVIVAFKQDGTGSRTVTAGSSIDFGTDIPDLTGIASGANAYTYVGFVYHPTTTKFRVVAISK